MIRIGCFIIIFFSVIIGVKAQYIPLDKARFLDSLNAIVNNNKNDSIKARANFTLANYWSGLDDVRSWKHLITARDLSKNNAYLQSIGLFYIGNYFWDTNKPLAKRYYMEGDKMLKRFHRPESYLFRAMLWADYGAIIQRENKQKEYIDILLNKCIPFAKQSGSQGALGRHYMDIGQVFYNTSRYKKAVEYFSKANTLLETSAPIYSSTRVQSYMRSAKNYTLNNELPLARVMLDSAKSLLAPCPESGVFIEYYESEGMYFEWAHDYKQALLSYERGIEQGKKKNRRAVVERMMYQKYKIYTKLKRYDKAERILLEIIPNQTYPTPGNRLSYYYALSEIYHLLGDFPKAYKWSDKSLLLQDSMYKARVGSDIDEMEIKYQTAEKEKQIISLNAEKKQTALILKNNKLNNWLLIGGCIFFMTIAIFTFVYTKSFRKLTEQKVIEMEQKQQIELSRAILNTEENERNRVAKDLHDGLGNKLTGIKINLSTWAKNHEIKDIELENILSQLDGSTIELRQIARNIMPQVLLRFGLKAAIEELCESVTSTKLDIYFEATGIENDIGLNEQITIYRIVQETLANALKHSQATEFLLQCIQNERRFYITAEDNGIGFDVAALTGSRGLGINNIRNRVTHLNGKMEIISEPGKGTIINIELDV